jgi:predicted CoA-binding protein
MLFRNGMPEILRSRTVQDLIKEFMAQKRFAIVGATDNPEKYGNQIFKNLRGRVYKE